MKSIYTVLLASTLALSACGKTYDPINKTDTIVAFGDSLTFGYGASKNNSYPAILSQISGYSIINAGLNGDTAENGKDRIYEVVEQYNPRVVILSLGGNDMLRKQTQLLKNNLSFIIEYLQSKKIKVLLLAEPLPEMTLMGVKDAKIYKEIAEKYNIYLLENKFSKYMANDEYKSDLIHLNALGYKSVAEDIYNQLKNDNIFQ